MENGIGKSRIALYDNLKFILVTLVVVGHFADCFSAQSDICKSIYLFIYAFHMPLFVFISGCFYNDKRITSKCLFYTSAGFLLKIALALCDLLVNGKANFSLLSDSGLPWFFFALAAYTFVSYLLRNQNRTYLLVMAVVLACFAGYDRSIGDFLYISRIIVFFPFYLAGTMVRQEKIIRLKSNRTMIVCALILLSIWAYLCFFELDAFYPYRHLFTGRNPFSAEVAAYGPLARLMCYGISALTGFAFLILTPGRDIKFVTEMGTHSIDVYFWHWPVYLLADHFTHFSSLFAMGWYGKAAFLCLAVILSVALSQGRAIAYPLKKIKNLCFNRK